MSTKQCPKCGHKRLLNDGLSDTECPKCGIIYAKFSSVKIETTKQCPFCKEEILKEALKCKHCGANLKETDIGPGCAVILLLCGIVFIILLFSGKLDVFWAKAISPFDKKPSIKITDLINDPKKALKMNKKLCSWAKREYLRNPSLWNQVAKESYCKE